MELSEQQIKLITLGLSKVSKKKLQEIILKYYLTKVENIDGAIDFQSNLSKDVSKAITEALLK